MYMNNAYLIHFLEMLQLVRYHAYLPLEYVLFKKIEWRIDGGRVNLTVAFSVENLFTLLF